TGKSSCGASTSGGASPENLCDSSSLGFGNLTTSEGLDSWDSWESQLQPTTEAEKETLHRLGRCRPCHYFAFKSDGCRAGSNCDFCHLCDVGRAKDRKRDTKVVMKALKARQRAILSAELENGCVDSNLFGTEHIVQETARLLTEALGFPEEGSFVSL
ncbi:unnamed protein product, partial [Polarella glacialis]